MPFKTPKANRFCLILDEFADTSLGCAHPFSPCLSGGRHHRSLFTSSQRKTASGRARRDYVENKAEQTSKYVLLLTFVNRCVLCVCKPTRLVLGLKQHKIHTHAHMV